MANVLIAGCGYVGCTLGRELAARGYGVFGLRRSEVALPTGIRLLRADLLDPKSLVCLPRELDSVVYAVSPSRRSPVPYREAYPIGLGNLLRALGARPVPPRRVFFVSSTAVYGQCRGEWVDESSATEPEDFAGRLLLEAEASLLRSGIPGTVLRLAGIYGPGRTGLLERVRRGALRCEAAAHHFSNRIHRDDAAGALRHLIGLEAPDSVYVGVDAEPACECDVSRWLAERLDVSAPPPRDARGEASRATGKRGRSARLIASGYQLRYPTFREGYAALLAPG